MMKLSKRLTLLALVLNIGFITFIFSETKTDDKSKQIENTNQNQNQNTTKPTDSKDSPKSKDINEKSGKIVKKGKKKFFTTNWRDAELKDFVKSISSTLGKNILIDDGIKGKKITIYSQKDVELDDAFSFMKTVLEANGFGVVEDKNLIRIVKLKDAVFKSPIIRVGRDPIPENEVLFDKISTQIVPIYNVSASELEPLLKRVVSPETEIIIYKESNTMVLSGSSADINKILKLIDKLDFKSDGPGSTTSAGDVHIYTLEYNEAQKLADVLTKLDVPTIEKYQSVDKKNPQQQKQVQKIRAVPHKESNAIIITADKDEWVEIQRIIKILDMPRKQVLLEVLIVELSSTDLNDFGIDWRARNEAYGQFNSGLASQGGVIDNKGRPTLINTLSGFSLGFLKAGRPEIIGILNANSSNENFNVLSAPQVLTLDNQEAEIIVGQDVPVRTQSRTGGTGGATSTVTVDNYEYRPTGIKLKFTPHINKNDRITIDLSQEVKNIAGLPVQGGNPTFNNRSIKTTITVDNMQTVVIGGLIMNDKQKGVTKIPLLGDIPLIGNLFRRTVNQNKRTNLMVFLTPHVLDSRLKADKMTIDKRRDQERMELEREKRSK